MFKNMNTQESIENVINKLIDDFSQYPDKGNLGSCLGPHKCTTVNLVMGTSKMILGMRKVERCSFYINYK